MDLSIPVIHVDDNDESNESIVSVLKMNGYRAVGFTKAMEALDHITALPRCVIILDMLMPIMDGWDFMSCLRSIRGHETHPVLVISGLRMMGSTRPLPDTAQGFIAKPVELEQFLSKTEELVRSLDPIPA